MSRLRLPLAVALISAGSVSYEILLVRIFAIEQFHHFAYMAIGVAMLGFGASGTLLALMGGIDRERSVRWFVGAAVLTAISLIASPALVHAIPLDPTQLPWDSSQWPKLALVYLLLTIPFAAVALAVLLAITLEPERPGRIYGASFVGSGFGAALAVAVLWFVFPVRVLAVPAVLASWGAVVSCLGERSRASAALAWGAVVVAALVFARPLWRLEVLSYKGLPQVEAYPEAQRVAERTSPLGWVVAVEAPAFHYAPGLSLVYRGELPKQTAFFVDGEIAGAATSWQDDSSALALLDRLPSAIPYSLGRHDSVLIIGAGGGMEVGNALLHGARHVVALELHPQLVELSKTLAPLRFEQTNPLSVEWVVGDARSYVARSRGEFDIVTIAPGGGFGTSAAGVHSLNEDFLHTVEAYVRYLELLSDEGVVAITRWLAVPPRENVRVILTAIEALRRIKPDAVGSGIVVARSWGTATVLVKPSGFTAHDIAVLSSWTATRRFDLDWYTGIRSPRMFFNILEKPTLYLAASAAVHGPDSSARFSSTYEFDVAPVHDARPYPHHFLRASAIGTFLKSDRGSWLPFAEWGYVALVATLIQSFVLAGMLMVVPVAIRSRAKREGRLLRLIGYFTAIGVAYLAAEIAAIQQLSLLLGHPVYAVATVIAAFLICSGVGSVCSDRLDAVRAWMLNTTLALALVMYAALLLGLVHLIQPGHLIVRATVALFALVPLAFLMGFPFPLGLRSLTAANTVRVSWAWAANGFGSVVAAPLAALIAIEAGSPTLFLVAAVAYASAAVFHRLTVSPQPA